MGDVLGESYGIPSSYHTVLMAQVWSQVCLCCHSVSVRVCDFAGVLACCLCACPLSSLVLGVARRPIGTEAMPTAGAHAKAGVAGDLEAAESSAPPPTAANAE